MNQRSLWGAKASGAQLEQKEILAEVERIVTDVRFARSPFLGAFLRYVVEQALAGDAAKIKAYTIATEALGRDAGFNPEADPIVRVQGGRLRKLLDLYYATDGATDPIRITIPKGGYAPQIARNDSSKPALLTSSTSSCCGATGTPLERPVIAIFPCEPIYAAPWQDGFCEVLAEEILDALDKFETVDIVPMATVMNAMQVSTDPRECGRRIGCDFILEGRFCSDGTESRLLVKLINVETGITGWSKAYDVDLTPSNKLSVQRQMASTLASEVAVSHGYAHRDRMWASRDKDIPTLNAYECVLQAHLYHGGASVRSFDRALAAAKRAVDIIPDCGTAWATLSELYCEGYRIGHGGLGATHDYLEKACASANRAYQLCPECAASSMAMADVQFAKGKFESAVKMGEVAMAQNPNDNSLKARFGMCLAYADEWLNGLAHIESALLHAPVALVSYNHLLAEGQFLAGNFQKSLEILENANSSYPFFGEMNKTVNYVGLGQKKAAEKAFARMSSHWPNVTSERVSTLLSRSMSRPVVDRYIDGLCEAGLPA